MKINNVYNTFFLVNEFGFFVEVKGSVSDESPPQTKSRRRVWSGGFGYNFAQALLEPVPGADAEGAAVFRVVGIAPKGREGGFDKVGIILVGQVLQ